jgi:hypothetical protein
MMLRPLVHEARAASGKTPNATKYRSLFSQRVPEAPVIAAACGV